MGQCHHHTGGCRHDQGKRQGGCAEGQTGSVERCKHRRNVSRCARKEIMGVQIHQDKQCGGWNPVESETADGGFDAVGKPLDKTEFVQESVVFM